MNDNDSNLRELLGVEEYDETDFGNWVQFKPTTQETGEEAMTDAEATFRVTNAEYIERLNSKLNASESKVQALEAEVAILREVNEENISLKILLDQWKKLFYGAQEENERLRPVVEAAQALVRLNPEYHGSLRPTTSEAITALSNLETAVDALTESPTPGERCRVCDKPIATAELCEDCAKGNNPFFSSKYKNDIAPTPQG